MATITQENIGLLHEKLTVKLEKTDYLPSFEKALKEYSKKANIPGFRKGMVPSGLIKKMYGTSLFTDEVLKTVDRELIGHLQNEKIEIFAQPIPMEADVKQIDLNNPADYSFNFEIGMKPAFQLADLAKAKTTRYIVTVTDEMINSEVERLQNRYGNMKDLDAADSEENVLNVLFSETDASGNKIESGITKDNSLLVKYFAEPIRKSWMGKKTGDAISTSLREAFDEKEREWIISDLGLKETEDAANKYFSIEITKIGQMEKRELNEDFFNQLYPGQEVNTEEAFRLKIKEEIQNYWKTQVDNQIHDQAYHQLLDHTQIDFPETFLKKWVKTQGDVVKEDEDVEKEFPKFLAQLKWTLISEKIVGDNNIEVAPDEIKAFAKHQLFSYMGGANLSDDQPWVNDYVEKMMKDRKFVEDAYHRLQTQKIFEWAATQVKPDEVDISAEDFSKMVEEHQHHHH
ncbi:MAG TPA: trigger factor [Chitinophagaceae bacterium]|nr:trigger factor [Chitinophagaceae bacterium]